MPGGKARGMLKELSGSDLRLVRSLQFRKVGHDGLIEFQTMFDEALENAKPQYWAGDGVHPTLAGHALMEQTWRRTVGL